MSNEISDVALSSVPQLVIAWLLVVGGARRCQVELNHYAVHNRLFKIKDKNGDTKKFNLNRWFVEIVSTILFIQDYDGYHKDHVSGHHRFNVFCGPDDADWTFLRHLGLTPGMTVQQCWIWLITTCFSPSFHATFLAARARSNFASINRYRRVMTVVWLSTVVTMTTALDVWIPVLVLLVFPLTVLYQISALIQFTCEHYWGAPFSEGETSPERHARLSHARYCLTAMPQRNGDGLARFVARLLLWALTVVLIDIPARIAILVGELVVHDRHHRFPAERSWALVLYLPEDEHTVHRSRENWGLIGALNAVFRHVYALGHQAT